MMTNFVIIIVTFIFAAFFVIAEFALVQTRITALQERKKAHPSKRVDRAIKMVTNLTEYLSTTQVGTSICGIILGWIGEDTFETILASALDLPSLHLNDNAVHAVSAVVGVLLLTYLEVVLTEIVPKNIAIDFPIKMLMGVVTPLHYFHTFFYPFVWLLNASANGIVRLMGMKPADENDEVLSQSEIISLSRNAYKGGNLHRGELLYMERAFDFDDKMAKDIMIDRTQLSVIDIKRTVNDALTDYLKTKFSRLPVVADGNKDKILGYVFNYDLIRQSRIDGNVSLTKVLRHLTTVPESTPITQVLQQMIRTRVPMVVVVDDYGGTSGIITDKDIYEELFGTVRDEIDDVADNMISKMASGKIKINGKTTTYDFERYFHDDLKEFDHTDAVTLSGYVVDNFPHIQEGDVVNIGGYKLKIMDYSNSYVDWFEVVATPDQSKTKRHQTTG
ncbi:hypothetical protein IV45_GL000907 [Limosilactobacillus secaliphilus]|uniref:Hemolysin n=2 Tax=Limosilactobacillus secaliphilus TaxID=396268 RepID=A0A0R2I802_9LACO|nr:hypothetical protein IV45_GL000907 [Limosilactobacillus secaliphilus]